MSKVKTFLKWFGLFWLASIPGKIVAMAVVSRLTQIPADVDNPAVKDVAFLAGFVVQLIVFGFFIWGSRRSWRSRPGSAYTGDDFMHPEVR